MRLGFTGLWLLCIGVMAAFVAMCATTHAADSTPAALPADTQLDLFLLVGQSNMAGRGKVEAQDKIANPRVWMLTKSLEWAPAVDPLHFDKPKVAGVGPGRTFAIAVAEAEPGVNIGLVPCAVGGTSIDEWKKGGKLYTAAMERAKAAMAHGTFKGILWHQGEADVSDEKRKEYPAKLKQLIADFRQDLNLPDLPFVVGELGPFHEKKAPGSDAFNAQLKEFAQSEPHCACASSDGLTDIGDQTHFNAASQREFGRRYAAAFLKLSGQNAAPKP